VKRPVDLSPGFEWCDKHGGWTPAVGYRQCPGCALDLRLLVQAARGEGCRCNNCYCCGTGSPLDHAVERIEKLETNNTRLRTSLWGVNEENARLRERVAELEAELAAAVDAHRAANIELKAALLAGIAELADAALKGGE